MKHTCLGWGDAAPVRRNNLSFKDEIGLRLCRERYVPNNLVADTLRRDERIHDVSLSVGPQARHSHRPAVRRLPVEFAHEPMTITQHPYHPLKA